MIRFQCGGNPRNQRLDDLVLAGDDLRVVDLEPFGGDAVFFSGGKSAPSGSGGSAIECTLCPREMSSRAAWLPKSPVPPIMSIFILHTSCD